MTNLFLTAFIISLFFFIGKLMEMKFINKEEKPFKFIIRDSLLIYVSAILGISGVEYLLPYFSDIETNISPTAFTDDPSF